MLTFQAERAALVVMLAAPADQASVQAVGREELHPRLRRVNRQNAAGLGRIGAGRQPQRVGGVVEDKVMVVAAAVFDLLARRIDRLADGMRAAEVKRRSGHGR